jgi:hypothetical protein
MLLYLSVSEHVSTSTGYPQVNTIYYFCFKLLWKSYRYPNGSVVQKNVVIQRDIITSIQNSQLWLQVYVWKIVTCTLRNKMHPTRIKFMRMSLCTGTALQPSVGPEGVPKMCPVFPDISETGAMPSIPPHVTRVAVCYICSCTFLLRANTLFMCFTRVDLFCCVVLCLPCVLQQFM